MMKKALVTGAASGLGLATAQYLIGQGWKVYALDYNEDGLRKIASSQFIPVQVDVSSEESIAHAVDTVRKTTDALDAIVNFAGVMVMGSLVETDASAMQRILNINLLGMYRINKAFFEMIEKGKGRYINVSSEYGALGAVPFNGFYGTVKHAVEMYSDALRRELMFLGIPVVKIRPGAFKSNMQGSAGSMLDGIIAISTHYKAILEKTRSMSESMTGIAKDPVILAKKVYRAMTAKRPKLVYRANNNLWQRFLSAMPERVQDFVYRLVLKP